MDEEKSGRGKARRKPAGEEGHQGLSATLRAIPKVDEFLGWVGARAGVPAALVKSAVRETLEEKRAAILAGTLTDGAVLAREALLPRFEALLAAKLRPHFRPVINATGVVVHTNLGRSLLAPTAMAAIHAAGGRYSNLELDLDTGKRGSRYSHVEELLCTLTGAEAALVVNNNAAAVLLALETLARGREVIVSRGQLVEIGGSFRIPEVMARSGARLVEVGATNRTHPRDYENAITEETALLLKVHASNYRIIGFTKEVPLSDLVTLGRARGLAVMEDLGSGSLVDLSRFGLEKEPTMREAVASGADVVTASGDKLLGGPQAGIILGRREVIERVKRNPLNRALRIDKFTLAGLEATLRLYLDEEEAIRTVPTLAMLAAPLAALRRRARRLCRAVAPQLPPGWHVEAAATESQVGGGALPEQNLPSAAVLFWAEQCSANRIEAALRAATLAVMGRIEEDRLVLDMRTVREAETGLLAEALSAAARSLAAEGVERSGKNKPGGGRAG